MSQCLKITEKCRVQHCERSELRLHFEWTKLNEKRQKSQFWRVFENETFLAIFKHCVVLDVVC